MGFGWDKNIKVEVSQEAPGGSRTVVVESTPKQVILKPNRHRMEDIINSACLVLGEMILMFEAQAQSQEKVMEMMKNYKADAPPPKKKSKKASGFKRDRK